MGMLNKNTKTFDLQSNIRNDVTEVHLEEINKDDDTTVTAWVLKVQITYAML